MKKKCATQLRHQVASTRRISVFGSFSLQVVLCSAAVCSMITGTLLAFFHPEAPAKASHPAIAGLTFAQRVAYQRTIEEVYWRHRIWPKENSKPKPSLDEIMSAQQIEKKVEDYLRVAQALEDYWQRPITPEQLQAELERIASHTKQPGVLRELVAALGNDPLVVAECLARPVLAERLITDFYAHDQRFHGELRRRAEAELQHHRSLKEMKQTSGAYTELEWIKSDAAEDNPPPVDAMSAQAVKMNSSKWQESVAKLAASFDTFRGRETAALGVRRLDAAFESAGMTAHSKNAPSTLETVNASTSLPIGKLSPLQEDNDRYFVTAVIRNAKDRLNLATITWPKEPLRSWLAKAEPQTPVTIAAVSANYVIPIIGSPSAGCTDDTWMATHGTPIAAGRDEHTAVWTGSEMIVWGGYDGGSNLNTGGRYDPSTDSWTATSLTNAPAARVDHTAVWTGTEMIVWGGWNFPNPLNTGGKYNPSTNSWTATTTTNAPAGRYYHPAVWTGSEMIVWGGFPGVVNTGGRYNPSLDTWTATSTTNAPVGRWLHTAVWTGSQMIVWGGYNDSGAVNTGGRYNASTNTWTATTLTNAPDATGRHTAIWSGSEMIIWGGIAFDLTTGERSCAQSVSSGPTQTRTTIATASPTPSATPSMSGGRYNPITDSWTATSTTNAPDGRASHSAVWTGSEMIIWGGDNDSGVLNSGGSYNPSTNSWRATSTTNVPDGRGYHTAVWTGSEMIVWGGLPGYLSTGGRYDPGTDTWTATDFTNAPSARAGHTSVWTGSEMIIWGGGTNTGGRYNPSTDSWRATSTTNAPSARSQHTAVWSGSEMIVWAGLGSSNILNTGGRYNPGTDSWTATNLSGAPANRYAHTAVWTGGEMIVWGGNESGFSFDNAAGSDSQTTLGSPTPTPTPPILPGTGGRYDPATNTWRPTTTTNAPIVRRGHTAVWTGTEMIVWGGSAAQSGYLNSGGSYNPNSDTWIATSMVNAPQPREFHTAVWPSSEMIIWGGYNGGYLNTGWKYNLNTDSWTAISTASAPDARASHTAVWTGSQMIVWGGDGQSGYFNSGGRYDPSVDNWTATSTANAPAPRASHTAVWTGSEMIVWGGYDASSVLSSGGRYCAAAPSSPTPTATASPTPTPTATASPTPTVTLTPTPTSTGSPIPTASSIGGTATSTPTTSSTPTVTPGVTPTPSGCPNCLTPSPTPTTTPAPRGNPTPRPRPNPPPRP